jgi:antitoxin component YwqK of YwqJK toxin-antitoxin module
MIFVFDKSVHNLEVTHDYGALVFEFVDDREHRITMSYWSNEYGGLLHHVVTYQNNLPHGTQYGWYSIQFDCRHEYIENYENGKKHGVQHYWNCHNTLYQIENYRNGEELGVQYYWSGYG